MTEVDRSVDLPVVLLGGAVNAVSVARSMGRRGRAVRALPEHHGQLPLRASRWVTDCPPLPADRPVRDSWDAWLAELPPSVVIPCGDLGIEHVIERRAQLVEQGHAPAEGDDDFLRAVLDKERTYELADRAGVEHPRTASAASVDDALAAAAVLGYPLGLKPRFSHRFATLGTRTKAVVVQSEPDLVRELTWLIEAGAEMLLTEIVPGPEDAFCSYYGYVDSSGQELLHYTKRKLRQYPARFGNGTYHLTEHVPEAAALGRAFFREAGLRGLGNVEFKRDERDGRLKLIECNPRITAASELVRRSRVDLAEIVYAGALGRHAPQGPIRYGLHQWVPLQDLRALGDYRREGTLTVPQWLGSLRGRQSLPLFALSDPTPSLVNAAQVGKRAVLRGIGRRRPAAPAAPAAALSR